MASLTDHIRKLTPQDAGNSFYMDYQPKKGDKTMHWGFTIPPEPKLGREAYTELYRQTTLDIEKIIQTNLQGFKTETDLQGTYEGRMNTAETLAKRAHPKRTGITLLTYALPIIGKTIEKRINKQRKKAKEYFEKQDQLLGEAYPGDERILQLQGPTNKKAIYTLTPRRFHGDFGLLIANKNQSLPFAEPVPILLTLTGFNKEEETITTLEEEINKHPHIEKRFPQFGRR